MAYGRFYAKKVEADGYKFDSDMEYQRYLLLKELEQDKKIANLKIHPCYELQEAYISYDGRKVKPLNYEADFEYYDMATDKLIVEDVKGFATPDFEIHRKLFDYAFKYSTSLVVLKYSKTTGFVPLEDYKKIMKSKRQKLIEEKNHYKNIVVKQEKEKVKEENKRQRELARIQSLELLVKEGNKLTKAQQARLDELHLKYDK